MADHYQTLGVSSSASAADLRAAYLKLARANHPDQFNGSDRQQAETRMQQINEAWNVLGVKHKRKEYDKSRPESERSESTGSSEFRGRKHFRAFDHGDGFDRSDIDEDETPIPGSKNLPQWAAFVPIGGVALGVPVMALGTMVGSGGLTVIGLMLLIFGAVSFLMMPLIVMARAERDPDL